MTDNITTLTTIGCDLGDKKSELFVLEPDGTARRCSIDTKRSAMRKFFSRGRAHVVLEVGTHSRWVCAELRALGHQVTVANPRQVKLIGSSDSKSDGKDCELLARLGRADVKLLAPVEHRGLEVQVDLATLKARDVVVSMRTKVVNHIRGMVKSFGERLPTCDADCFHRKTRELVPDALRSALSPLYELLGEMERTIKDYERGVERLGKKYPDVAVVSQPTGVGTMTALAFVLCIEDKDRFRRSRTVGAYFGLRPRRSQSGDFDPQLRITKAGDGYVRRLLVNASHYVLGNRCKVDSDLRRWGLELAKRGGKNAKKRAVVAVARKLAVLMHRLWVTGEVYEPLGYREKAERAAA